VRKRANLTGGYGNTAFGPSESGGVHLDAASFGMALPVAAIMLASYGGYTLANKSSDQTAADQRRKRIKDNLNRLSKANLDVLRSVRKEAGLGGTMFNPFQGVKGLGGQVYVPEWFRPSGSNRTTPADALAFKTLALTATYGLGAAGLKYLLGSMERKKELQSGNAKITEAVKATMPIISPDANLRDLGKEEREDARGLEGNVLLKESEEKGWFDSKMDEYATGHTDQTKGSLWTSTAAAVLLLGLGAFGAGAVLTKNWADDRDPNRERIKQAEKAARRMALQERPPAIVGNIDPKIKQQLDAHIGSGRLNIRPALAAGSLEDQEIDPTDSLSKNIATV